MTIKVELHQVKCRVGLTKQYTASKSLTSFITIGRIVFSSNFNESDISLPVHKEKLLTLLISFHKLSISIICLENLVCNLDFQFIRGPSFVIWLDLFGISKPRYRIIKTSYMGKYWNRIHMFLEWISIHRVVGKH